MEPTKKDLKEALKELSWDEVCNSFDEIELDQKLLRGIYAYAYEIPTAIQQRAIVPCISGRDVIVQAEPGSGKTAAICIAVLQQTNLENRFCQALILTDTPETAQAIHKMLIELGKYLNVTCHACAGGGGAGANAGIKEEDGTAQVVVGSPGRVNDMLSRKSFCKKNIKIFVLDEADKTLRTSRLNVHIYKAFRCLNRVSQVILTSASNSGSVEEFKRIFMREQVTIKIPTTKSIEPATSGGRCEYSMKQKSEDTNAAVEAVSVTKSTVRAVFDGCIDPTSANKMCLSFEELALNRNLLRGILTCGYDKPSDLQQRAIVPCINGLDVIIQGQGGTGKTSTFSIAILQQINPENRYCQALILVPIREAAKQIQKDITALGDYLNITCHTCVGGTNVKDDKRKLENGVQIVVGTPGRVYDMMIRKCFLTNHIKILVLDRAEELLSEQFKSQTDKMLKCLKKDIQVILTSTSMTSHILECTKEFMRQPVIIRGEEKPSLDGIKQFYVLAHNEDDKLLKLFDLIDTLSDTRSMIIFCNSYRKVTWLEKMMRGREHTHGRLAQKDREIILNEFRAGCSRVLITTDLLCSVGITHTATIVNYDLPTKCESYSERTGRGGPLGRKGVIINFVTEKDKSMLKDVEEFFKTRIEEMPSDVADCL